MKPRIELSEEFAHFAKGEEPVKVVINEEHNDHEHVFVGVVEHTTNEAFRVGFPRREGLGINQAKFRAWLDQTRFVD